MTTESLTAGCMQHPQWWACVLGGVLVSVALMVHAHAHLLRERRLAAMRQWLAVEEAERRTWQRAAEIVREFGAEFDRDTAESLGKRLDRARHNDRWN